MIRYLALGDSYTIGEAVDEVDSFPYQLLYGRNGMKLQNADLKVIAVTGWTTSDLLDAIKKEKLHPGGWSVVSLLIGVNNQYQNKPFALYKNEFKELIDYAISMVDGDSERVFIVSIPDYSVTAFAQDMDKAKISVELKRYNTFAKDIANEVGSHWINITEVSLRAEENPSLIATDGLHPSAQQYTLWVEEIYPIMKRIINNE